MDPHHAMLDDQIKRMIESTPNSREMLKDEIDVCAAVPYQHAEPQQWSSRNASVFLLSQRYNFSCLHEKSSTATSVFFPP